MKVYKSEIDIHPFPRSEKSIKALASLRGSTSGCKYAESFVLFKRNFMKNIDNIKIYKNSTIKEALNIISLGSIRIAIVVDKKDKLLGTLTDGDVRRGLLSGLNMNSCIDSIVFKNPIVAKKKMKKKAIKNCSFKKNLPNTSC